MTDTVGRTFAVPDRVGGFGQGLKSMVADISTPTYKVDSLSLAEEQRRLATLDEDLNQFSSAARPTRLRLNVFTGARRVRPTNNHRFSRAQFLLDSQLPWCVRRYVLVPPDRNPNVPQALDQQLHGGLALPLIRNKDVGHALPPAFFRQFCQRFRLATITVNRTRRKTIPREGISQLAALCLVPAAAPVPAAASGTKRPCRSRELREVAVDRRLQSVAVTAS